MASTGPGAAFLGNCSLADPEITAHPNAFYRAMRESDPVYLDEQLCMYLVDGLLAEFGSRAGTEELAISEALAPEAYAVIYEEFGAEVLPERGERDSAPAPREEMR